MTRDPLAEIAEMEAPAKSAGKVAEVLDAMGKDLKPGVVAAMRKDSGLSTAAITRWFRREGMEISDRTILRHRRGECVCGG